MKTDRERPDFDDIRNAFERMTPSAEAEERMLASLLKAAHDSEATSPGNARKLPRWLYATAACLVLIVGGGALGYGALTTHDVDLNRSEQAAQFAESTATDDQTGEDEGAYSDDQIESDLSDRSENALSHPLIELSSGTRLRIVLGEDSQPRTADTTALTAKPEPARALDETGEDPIPCYVLVSADADLSYAVSYTENGQFYQAEPVS